ncbi:hypothetical protein HAX54_047858 [Datura stramonium]|uniref:NADH:ubiquinone oxidoreductase-like 20kDa subunit domain-containing protein n=1 Tax=Datura stramonium TaxID=4076 RepID=A0ABS8STA8_DATST|nr:hypothetical protein [Datura stramonium]
MLLLWSLYNYRRDVQYRFFVYCSGSHKLIPVDVYLPGCPPKPESMIDAITKLRKKISRELYEDRIRSQRANRCFTTNHKFHIRRSIHTGNYDQRVSYHPPSTSEIPTEIFSNTKFSIFPRISELDRIPLSRIRSGGAWRAVSQCVSSYKNRDGVDQPEESRSTKVVSSGVGDHPKDNQNGTPKELTAEPYEVRNSQVRFYGKELNYLFRPGRTGHSTGRYSEIAEAWFDQAAEYWKQAIALIPGDGDRKIEEKRTNYRNLSLSLRFTNYLTVGGSLCMPVRKEEASMIIRSPGTRSKILQIGIRKNFFRGMGQTASQEQSKGPDTTT